MSSKYLIKLVFRDGRKRKIASDSKSAIKEAYLKAYQDENCIEGELYAHGYLDEWFEEERK